MALSRRIRRRSSQRGSLAMFIVIFLTILATIPLGLQLLQISNRKTTLQIHETVQADNVARAGLVEAISWFRRQPGQPVRNLPGNTYGWADGAFYPRTSTNTATSDTLDESIGLVKEYALNDDNTLWARYEVRRQKNPASNPNDATAVHDISDRRIEGASAGDGLAWYVESRGIVYRRRAANKAYNVSPNEVVGRARAATEIRRIAIVLPLNAAAIVNSRSNVTVTNNGRLRGGNNCALGYYTGATAPTVSGSGSQILGTPNTYDVDSSTGSGTINFQSIFGVNTSELKLMADYAVSSAAELPSDYPSLAVVYINGNATFDDTRRLRGGGILFVNGNLTIESTANALFSGVIFVTGTCVIKGPSLISGSVISQGSLTLNGNGDVAEVDFDASILNSIRQQVAQYRENKSSFYTFSATK